MFKKVYLPLLGMLVFLSLLLTGCGCKHEWRDATCEAPKTCAKCNTTKGDFGHDWMDPTCEAPKTCAKCSKTEGEALGHKWEEATTEAPKTCERCQKTEDNLIGIQFFKSELCKPLFGTWSGNINIPSQYFELPTLSGGLDFKIILTFHNDGNYEATAILANKDTVIGHLWAHYVNAFYAEFAKQGLDEAQADAAMVATYGMDVKAYSKKFAEETDFDKLTSSLVEGGVYYVSDIQNGNFTIKNAWNLHFASDWGNGIDRDKYRFQIHNDTRLYISQYPFNISVFPYRYPTPITLTKN